MELGPRDRLSQAFWHEKQKGRTIEGPHGAVVHLDLRHLGEAKLRERLPQIYELAEEYLGVDPAKAPIPVLPAVHYTMGGILVDGRAASPLPGLYSAGECSSVGIHGANRLGSNSLTELLVFGKVAGEEAATFREIGGAGQFGAACRSRPRPSSSASLGSDAATGGNERIATLRKEMAQSMEDGCGIYRLADTMQATCDKLAELKAALHATSARRQVERLEHRVAARHRARLPARRGAGDGAFGAAAARNRAARTSAWTASSSATTSTS